MPVEICVVNASPWRALSFTLELLRPHEPLLVVNVDQMTRRKTIVDDDDAAAKAAVAAVASGASIVSSSSSTSTTTTPGSVATASAADAARRHAAAVAATTRACGAGSGGVNARASCVWLGAARRSVRNVAPRATVRIAALVAINTAGVHNVARVRLLIENNVLPPDMPVLVTVVEKSD